MGYDSVYRARAVKYEPPVVTAYVPQVFGQTAIEIVDSIGTPATGMGWVWFQGGNPEFPVWTSGLGGGGGSNGGGGGGGGGTVTDTLWVGPNPPVDTSLELWYDTDEVPQYATATDNWNAAWGVVASATLGANVMLTTAYASIASVTTTLVAGRRYAANFSVRAMDVNVVTNPILTSLFKDGVEISMADKYTYAGPAGNYGGGAAYRWIIVGDGVSHAFSVRARTAVTGQIHCQPDGGASAFTIEDLGPVTRLPTDTPPPTAVNWTAWDARYSSLTETEVISSTLQFAAGFEDYLTNYGPCKVTRVGPMVICQGLVKRSIGQTAFTSGTFATVPSGFRPTVGNQLFTTMVSTPSWCRIDVIYTTGAMSLYTSPAVSVAAGGWIGVNVSWVVS